MCHEEYRIIEETANTKNQNTLECLTLTTTNIEGETWEITYDLYDNVRACILCKDGTH